MTAPQHTPGTLRRSSGASRVDQLPANSKLKSSEYAVPVLGLIFLRYAGQRFAQVHDELVAASQATPTVARGFLR